MYTEYTSDLFLAVKKKEWRCTREKRKVTEQYIQEGDFDCSRVNLKDCIYAKLDNIHIGTTAQVALEECIIAQKEAIHESLMNGKNCSDRLDIINCVREFIREIDRREGLAREDNVGPTNWGNLVELATDLKAMGEGHRYGIAYETRDWNTAKCMFELCDNGIEVEFKNGSYHFYEGALLQATLWLEKDIDKIGGAFIIRHVLKSKEKVFNNDASRYVFYPQASSGAFNIVENAVPWNLLLNLGIKHLYDLPSTSIGNEVQLHYFSQLKRKAQVIAGSFDVEPFSQYQDLNLPASKTVARLIDYALYSSLHEFVQIDPELAKIIMDKVASVYGSSTVGGTDINSIVEVSKVLLDEHPKFNSIFKRDRQIKKISHFKKYTNKNSLLQLFCLPPGCANENFTLPFQGADLYRAPLVKSKENNFYFLPKSISAKSYVENLFSHVRNTENGKNFNGDFGIYLEEILANLHQDEVSIEVTRGRYDGSVYESDGVIEDEEDIHFFELKMKALLPASQSGDSVSLIRDLVKSLLVTQAQAMNHEYELRTRGKLVFSSGAAEKIVEHRGRTIHRHSVVLFDYGSLQYKQLVFNFLECLVNHDFSHHDEKIEGMLRDLDPEIKKYRDAFTRLHKAGFTGHVPFHGSSFISLSDIACMLRISQDKKEYFGYLRKINTIVVSGATPLASIMNYRRIIRGTVSAIKPTHLP